MKRFAVASTKRKQVVDITDRVHQLLRESSPKEGLCHLFVLHTTACLTVMDLDPGTDLDLLDALEELLPKLPYRHPHDPSHVGDHINAAIIGPSLLVPFEGGKPVLGTWQRIVLIELSGPREREIAYSFIK